MKDIVGTKGGKGKRKEKEREESIFVFVRATREGATCLYLVRSAYVATSS